MTRSGEKGCKKTGLGGSKGRWRLPPGAEIRKRIPRREKEHQGAAEGITWLIVK